MIQNVVYLLLALIALSLTAKDPPRDWETRADCTGVPGIPGIPGPSGTPGKDGTNGKDGRDGRDGYAGEKGANGAGGAKGERGEKGSSGKAGPKGNQGEMGLPGQQGPAVGGHYTPNWKQCTWNSESSISSGVLQICTFRKFQRSTAVRVLYAGALRVKCPGRNCCGRWYFTFNGTECSNPVPIDGVIFVNDVSNNDLNMHRPSTIEGICENLPAGQVKVGFTVGKCKRDEGSANYYTGYNSFSRILIEEYPPPQQ